MHSRMFPHRQRAPYFKVLLGAVSIFALFTGCGSNSITTGPVNGLGCFHVGVLLPDTTSPRWEGPGPFYLRQALTEDMPTVTVDFANASGSASTQQSQAQADLTNGDCILIVAAVDSTAATAIVTAAKAKQVPVIAYDRFIYSDDLNAYVSYDSMQVGELQGQYIVAHYQDAQYHYDASYNRNHIAFFNGSPTDFSATRSADGTHQVLDPLIQAKTFNNVYETSTPNEDPAIGEQEMEKVLSVQSNNLQVVVAGSDDLADGAIQALEADQLGGQVLIAGQGATVPGLQHILEGSQAMTVYESIRHEAVTTADLVLDVETGRSITTFAGYTTIKNPQGSASIPSVLETPIAVDKSNMASTVIADGVITASDICTGLPSGTDTAGICS